MIFRKLAVILLLLSLLSLYLTPLMPFVLFLYLFFFVIYFYNMIKINSNAFGEIICSMPGEGCKSVYLTFDDGPDLTSTPAILSLLEREKVPATFFLTGKKAEKNREITRAIISADHGLGNHTYTHNNFLTLSSKKTICREISMTNKLLRDEFNYECRLFRPCAGLKDMYIMDSAKKLGMKVIGWNRRSLDTVSRSPQRVFGRLADIHAKNGDILLLHDRPTKLSLEDKLLVIGMVIEFYRDKGFIFLKME